MPLDNKDTQQVAAIVEREFGRLLISSTVLRSIIKEELESLLKQRREEMKRRQDQKRREKKYDVHYRRR